MNKNKIDTLNPNISLCILLIFSCLLLIAKSTYGFILLFLSICFPFMWENGYMKKYKYRVVELNNIMNTSYDIIDYFNARDELFFHLTQMKRYEVFIQKQNSLNKKPSNLLNMLVENEELNVKSAILRMMANYKKLIRENGVGFSNLFFEQTESFRYKLSQENQKEIDNCLTLLQEYEKITGKIEEVDNMGGHDFEYWCADLLKKNGFENVQVTPGSGDQGVDIIAEKAGIHYAIQCKCYSSDLGNTPVQEVYAGKEMYNCQVAVVMTNRYFTNGAKELAEKTRVLLWDRDKLIEMIN